MKMTDDPDPNDGLISKKTCRGREKQAPTLWGGLSRIMARILWAVWICLVSLATVCAQDAASGDDPGKGYSIVAYGGRLTSRTFGKTVFNVPGDLDIGYLYALGLNRHLFNWPRHFSWEGELLLAKHREKHPEGSQHYEEYIACILLRYHHFPWNRRLNTTIALGEGLSYTSELSRLETRKTGIETRRLLNYLAFELTVSHPRRPEWSLMYRIHHRSGIFGLMGGLKGVSDYYVLGVRYHF